MSDHAYSDLDAFFQEEAWLMRLAKRLVRDDAAAQDLVQETWAAALSTPIADKTQPRAWLGTVIRRLANKQREKMRPIVGHQLDEEHSRVASPVETVQKFEAGNLLRNAIDALDEPYKSTLLLRYQAELGQRAIAQEMEVSERTVRNRLRTGHERLKATLGADFEPGASRHWALALTPLLPRDFFTSPPPLATTASAKAAGTLAAAVLIGASAIGAINYFMKDPIPTAPETTIVSGAGPSGTAPTGDSGSQAAVIPQETEGSGAEEEAASESLKDNEGSTSESTDSGPGILVSESRFRLDGVALAHAVVRAFNSEAPGIPPAPTDAAGNVTLQTVPGKVSISFRRHLTQQDLIDGLGYGKPAFSKDITIPQDAEFEPIDFNVATGRLVLVNAPEDHFQTDHTDLEATATVDQGFSYKSLTCAMGEDSSFTFYKVPATEVLVVEVVPIEVISSPGHEAPVVDESEIFDRTFTILPGQILTVDLATGEQVYTPRTHDDY